MHRRVMSLLFGVIAAGCSQRPPATDEPAPKITGIEWQLTELAGQPAGLGAGGRPATLNFDDAEKRANGFAGCNRFAGTYQISGGELIFSPLIMTKMACEAGMELEQGVGTALAEVRNYRLSDRKLELLNDSSIVVARYEKP